MIDGKVIVDLKPLEGLKQSLVNKIMRKATTKAAKPVKVAVKSGAQKAKRYGYLNKSIGVKVKTYKDNVIAVVGPRSKYSVTKGVYKKGKKKGADKVFRPSYYAHLVEKDTKHSKAKPFLKPALDSTENVYLDTLNNEIAAQIASQLPKL